MNFEKLVADRELCEQIPAGEFLDTAFCWHYTELHGFVCGRVSGCCEIQESQWILEKSNYCKIARYRQQGKVIFPAPMLEEIMAAMPHCRVYKKTAGMFVAVHEKTRVCHMDAATAALKLWLKVNKKGN